MSGYRSRPLRATASWLGAVLLLACIAGQARAGQLSDEQRRVVLEEAMAAYDAGIEAVRARPEIARASFRDAAERMQLLVDDGVVNGRLLYNLANAYLQTEELGRAIANYRRAERLMPGDPRLRANLAFARSRCRLQLEPTGGRALGDALLWWHHGTTVRARTTLFAVAYVLFWVVLSLRLRRRAGSLTVAAIILALASAATGASLGVEMAGVEPREGVIVRDDVIVRKGNGMGFEPMLEEPLHQGVEFDLAERRGDWLLIELADGTSGWVRASEAEVI